MNGTPGRMVVPGETCIRPCGCSRVIGSIQIQEPSSVRQKASRTSRSVIGSPRSHLHHRLIVRRFQPRPVGFYLTALCSIPNRPATARKASIGVHVFRYAVRAGFSPRNRNAGRRRAGRASARRSRHGCRSLGHRRRASTRQRVPEGDRPRLSPVGVQTAARKSGLLDRTMPGDTPYTRTFIRAIETLGSIERLANALGTSVIVVGLWVAGRANPPPSVFLRAIDIVADGGVVPRQKTSAG